jgi:LysM repeat protein
MRKQNIISIGGKMTRSLIFKAFVIVLAVVLLQLAVAPESKAAPVSSGGGFYYTVQYGDTLSGISWKFGVSPYDIARANGLHNPDFIYAGQVLYIPAGSRCHNCGVWYPQPKPRPQPSGCYNNCYHQPVKWYGGCGNNCYQQNYYGYHGCGYNCYKQGYGYDYTGYYYDGYYKDYQRYSYTCGYNYNCY